MNTVPRPPQAQAAVPQSLAEALAAVFSTSAQVPFSARLVGFTKALIPQSRAWGITLDAAGQPDAHPADDVPDAGMTLAKQALSPDAKPVLTEATFMAAKIALDTGQDAALVVELRGEGQAARALAHERLTLLARLSIATYRSETVDLLQNLLRFFAELAQSAGTQAPDLQSLSDMMAAFFSAEYVAVARFDGQKVHDLHISGQAHMGKGARVATELKSSMAETARLRLCEQTRAFTAEPGQQDGLVMHLAAPRRNASMLPFLAASAGKLAPHAARRGVNWRAWARRSALVGVLCGVAFLPIPDGVSLPATVAAVSHRIVTSPLDAPLAGLDVRAGDRVVAGETVLGRFDTRALDLELIAAQASYSRALLDRERARAGRLAADLRTAELEAERVLADIALLEARKETAVLMAPISGLVIGDGLGDMTGALMRRGDLVLEIADPSAMELDVSVPQSQVAKVGLGQAGAFRPDFDPSLRFDTQVVSISPAAPSGQRAPLFPAQASLSDAAVDTLRPGMTGVVALDRTWRPIWQVVGRGLRDWILLRLWV